MSPPSTPASRRQFSNEKNLARAIFQSEHPEQFIKTVPAQSLYLTIKQAGLSSSIDLIEIASIEQCRLLLDFDCWHRDTFNEEAFWEWLGLTDAGDSLEVLQKIFKSVDLKLIALMIARHVEVHVLEHSTDTPPGPQFHTTDNGITWLHITVEDPHKHFLLGRLLALLFETNSDLFYQILLIPQRATPSELEEESFQEKCKRLAGEGVPEQPYAAQIHAPIQAFELRQQLASNSRRAAVEGVPVIEPLIASRPGIEPLSSLARENALNEEFESELSLVMNAAIIFFNVDFSETGHVMQLAEQVRGAINIGLQSAQTVSGLGAPEIYSSVGLQGLYRHGLSHLFPLRKMAKARLAKEEPISDSKMTLIVEAAARYFPEIPVWFTKDQEPVTDPNSLEPEYTAIEHIAQVEKLKTYLTTIG